MKKVLLLFGLTFLLAFTGCCSTPEVDNLKEVFEIKEINLEMVKCPAGSFMMGEPGDKKNPIHSVKLTKPFYIGKYEITQSQYEAIIGENPSEFINPNNPVENVSWIEADQFCDKLNQKYFSLLPKDYVFDLPTEAQWEYACRAGTNSHFSNGKDLTEAFGACSELEEIAWYYNNANKTTHIIGQKKPNSWGIYDMHGNVNEWCRDWYDNYSNQEVIDPIMPKSRGIIYRVYRGGNSCEHPYLCVSSRRGFTSPSLVEDFLGFRIAIVPISNSNKKIDIKALTISNSKKTDESIKKPISIEKKESNKEPEFDIEKNLDDTFVIKEINLEMIKCQAGTFIMGSPDREARENKSGLKRSFNSGYNELQHKVTISKPYYIGKYEVTQHQYEIIMGDNPSKNKGSNKPVDYVSYKKATEFCKKLNNKYINMLPKGYVFALPTEAQWEYACRAGTDTAFNNNKNLDDEYDFICTNIDDTAWYKGNASGTIHDVGQKNPNSWGIYDMHGNVNELCRDKFYPYTKNEVKDPYVSHDGKRSHIMRGGFFHAFPVQCRSASRFYCFSEESASDGDGFRVVIVPKDYNLIKEYDLK